MTADIVSLLRAVAEYAAGALSSDEVSIAQRAADEIERLRAENARLTTENGMLRQDLAETQDLYDQHRRAHGKVAARLGDTSHALGRAQALISWIDGACTDRRPHADIEAAITRWKDEQC